MYKQYIHGFINLFFPASCLACKHILTYGESYLCTHCLGTLPDRSFYLEEGNDKKILEKFYGKVPIWHANALFTFTKKGHVQGLIHEIKYKKKPELAEILGRYYGSLLKNNNRYTNCHAIIPVPIHPIRLRNRGYNQSLRFAQGLATSLCIPYYEGWLIRSVHTDTQTKKSRLERWSNVQQVFALSDQACIEGKDIILVDDLITTGATLTACAKVLFHNKASKVNILTLAVAK